MIENQLVFIADLNELENGNLVPVSMDFTVNSGPRVLVSSFEMPEIGKWVLIHSDDDDTLYQAQVASIQSERDLTVRIDWETGTPVMNSEFSAQDISQWIEVNGPSTVSDEVSVL